ncbi:sigma factor [Streptomyces lydicamycinicus]|uniref:sigma factor n=1 Tax=Streptomyces lydicamycinicus TaxID=1546107 RepID=UPI003C300C89
MLSHALICAAQNQDTDAVAAVLEAAEPYVREAAARHVGTAAVSSAGHADLFEELCQEGRLAALEALGTYRPDKGAQYTTHAYRRIHMRIYEAANGGRDNGATPDQRATFLRCLGVVGGDWEAAEYLCTILPGDGHRMSAETAGHVRRVMQGTDSLDAPAGVRGAEGETIPLVESLADPYSLGLPDDLIEARDLDRRQRAQRIALAHALLATVDDRKAQVLRLTYGVAPDPHLANEDGSPDNAAIAEVMGIDRANTVAVMRTRTLAKLRAVAERVSEELEDEAA